MSKHVKTCQKMSLFEVVCDVSSIIVIFGPAPNLEVWSAFWDGRTYASLYSMSHCHTTSHLRSQSLVLHEHLGVFRRGGIGAAAHFESSEARLMWIVSKQILPSYHLVVQGSNGSNPSET